MIPEQTEANYKAFWRYVRKNARRNKIATAGANALMTPHEVHRLYSRLNKRKWVGGKRKKTT